jgi:hypothetical protein
VRASSNESSVGWPFAALEKFITLTTTGVTSPVSFCWSLSADIQAPLRLLGRAK